jgi:hypothetical protein
MEVSQALADLAEVRSRLAAVQRFRGLSGWAAAASGIAAVLAGLFQTLTLAYPATGADVASYVTIWGTCLAFGLAVNYGAIGLWVARHWSLRTQAELRTVGMTIAPAIVAGGFFTAALWQHHLAGMLPGTWCVCYALGLLASRSMVPRGVLAVAGLFAATGAALLFAHDLSALRWWVMPSTFGVGQLLIGAIILRDENQHAAE